MNVFPHPVGTFEIEHGPTGDKYDVIIRQCVEDLTVGTITVQESVTMVTVLHQPTEMPWYASMRLPELNGSDGLHGTYVGVGYDLSIWGERWLSVALRAVEDYSMGLRGMHYAEILP